MTDSAPDRAQAGNAAGLVFVLGFPRSGTTLLGQILAALPEVALLEESEILTDTAGAFVRERDGIERLAELTPIEIAAYRQAFWRRAQALVTLLEGRIVVEQTALNTVYLPVIDRFFPDAKIAFVIRDPRDVVFSCFRRKFEPTPFTLEFHSLESTAEVYDRTMRLAEIARAKMAAVLIDLRYEDLLSDFDGETKRLCGALGLVWSEEMRDFHTHAVSRSLTTASAPQIRRGLTRDSVGAWRPYREHMASVLPLLAPWVARFGYPQD
jgi:hypothetical protein